jgi:hypothetical protein
VPITKERQVTYFTKPRRPIDELGFARSEGEKKMVVKN